MPPNPSSPPPKERRSGRRRSIIDNLHFSGKVIMASVLFGFGLLLVGAILMVIAVGKQETPLLLQESQETASPIAYVGPGVMGVGGLFVVVGTIMCLIETRVLKRRRQTFSDNRPLVTSEAPVAALEESIECSQSQERMKDEEQSSVNSTQGRKIEENLNGKESREKTKDDKTFSHVAEVHSGEDEARQPSPVKKTTNADDGSDERNASEEITESRPSKEEVILAQPSSEELVKAIERESNTDATGQITSLSNSEENIPTKPVESEPIAIKGKADGQIDRDPIEKETYRGDKDEDKRNVEIREDQQPEEKETINEDKAKDTEKMKSEVASAGDNDLPKTSQEDS